MILKLIVDDQLYELNVPEDFLTQAESFFTKMDQDMNAGWQMGREWVENPNTLQRAQIAANKLFTAVENENHDLGRLMAGYIVSRVPEVDAVELTAGTEIHDIVIRTAEETAQPAPAPPAAMDPTFYPAGHEPAAVDPTLRPQGQQPASGAIPTGLNKMEAMAQAGKDVSQIFRAGRQWKFSMYNHATGQWEESPAIGDKAEAEKLRDFAFKKRFDELCS